MIKRREERTKQLTSSKSDKVLFLIKFQLYFLQWCINQNLSPTHFTNFLIWNKYMRKRSKLCLIKINHIFFKTCNQNLEFRNLAFLNVLNFDLKRNYEKIWSVTAGGMTKDKDSHEKELDVTYLDLCLRYTEKLTKIYFIT